MGLFSSKRKKQNETFILLDIQESSVSASVVATGDSNSSVPVILYSNKTYFEIYNEGLNDRVIDLMSEHITKELRLVQKEDIPEISKVVVSLHPVWYETHLRQAVIKRDTNFWFSKKSINPLKNKELSKLRGGLSEGEEIFSNFITDIKINGYSEEVLSKRKVYSVDIHMSIFSFSKYLKKKIEESVNRQFHQDVSFVPYTMAFYSTVRDVMSYNNRFLLITISGEITEAFQVNDSHIEYVSTVNIGKHSLIREVAKKMGMEIFQVESKIKMLENGHLESIAEEDLKFALSEVEDEYKKKYRDLISLLYEHGSIPKDIIISTSSLLSKWFKEIFTKSISLFKKLDANSIHAIIMTPHILHDYCNYSFDTKRDATVMINAIYINRYKKDL